MHNSSFFLIDDLILLQVVGYSLLQHLNLQFLPHFSYLKLQCLINFSQLYKTRLLPTKKLTFDSGVLRLDFISIPILLGLSFLLNPLDLLLHDQDIFFELLVVLFNHLIEDLVSGLVLLNHLLQRALPVFLQL